jgi:hypothetical protein
MPFAISRVFKQTNGDMLFEFGEHVCTQKEKGTQKNLTISHIRRQSMLFSISRVFKQTNGDMLFEFGEHVCTLKEK